MVATVTKDSIDLGIVVRDPETSLAFYRDVLGLVLQDQLQMPGGITMYRLACGSSVIKLLHPSKEPAHAAAPGGIQGAYGYRYWTVTVSNIDELVAQCAAAGVTVVVPVTSLRPGVSIAIVQDPDGNWVEFLQQ